MIRIRASSLSQIMTEPKSKSETLSVGAKSFLDEMAKEYVYGYTEVVSSKYMDKGTTVEDQSIELYNEVHFTSYKKNTERKNNDWLTGECDIFTGSKIIDIKSSWSLPTFPATMAKAMDIAIKSGYDWQMAAYMMLWNVDEAEVAFCMVDTPDELIRHEQEDLHYVSHLDPELRVTKIQFARCKDREAKIIGKVEAANAYLQQVVKSIQERQ